MLLKVFGLAVALGTAFADNVSPEALRGDYSGTLRQGFGQASSTDPNSLECIANGGVIEAESITLTIGETEFTYSGSDQITDTFSNRRYTMGGTPAFSGTWADYQGSETEGIIMVRDSADQVVCKYASIVDKEFVIVTLGGEGFSWQDQCQTSTYQAIPDVAGTPLCESQPGSKSPYRSTTLEVYKYLGNRASGANTAGVAAAAAAVLGGAFVAAL